MPINTPAPMLVNDAAGPIPYRRPSRRDILPSMPHARRHETTWPLALAAGFLAALSACSGNVSVGDPGGSGATAGAGTGGTGGGAGSDPGTEYTVFCNAQAECKAASGHPFDTAACEASAQCDSMLLHHPGGPLFDCLAEACSLDACLLSVYEDYFDSEHTAAAKAFQERCGLAIQDGSTVFEDYCVAGALFTDEALETMTQCFELPTCAEVKTCALETYALCTGWLYQLSP
jgi:hypothetical protein